MADEFEKQLERAIEAATLRSAPAGSQPGDGVGEFSPDVIAEARKKAAELLKNRDMVEGLKEGKKVTMAIGLPAARITLRLLVEAGSAPAATKQSLLARIRAISPITEQVGISIEFMNQETKQRDTVWLLLDECPKNHDLDAQLNILKPHIPADKWQRIIGELSVLVALGRSAYVEAAQDKSLMDDIIAHLPAEDKGANFKELSADKSNTTLWVLERLEKRVGIFIRRPGK